MNIDTNFNVTRVIRRNILAVTSGVITFIRVIRVIRVIRLIRTIRIISIESCQG
jgi:hypothetical protein